MPGRCQFKNRDGTQCENNAMLENDETQPIKTEYCTGRFYSNNPSTQVFRPTKPSTFCYYHDKIMKGLFDGPRRKSRKAEIIAW